MRCSPATMLFLLLSPFAVGAGEPLHQQIDRFITAGVPDFAKKSAGSASDAEFLRRVTLDLAGTTPSHAETRAFLDDKDSARRAKLIDTLLASPGYGRRMTQFFDVMLMERRRDAKVSRANWETFLRASIDANKPYDEMVREILSADGVDAAKRGPAKFYLDRDGEVQAITRDIGRLFLGRNMQCAQCHDSPLVDDYKQEHYYGIQAFLNRTTMFPNANVATAVLGEKAEGEISFTSVFDATKAQKSTLPKMPGGKAISEPKFEKGKEYKVAPTAATVRPVPNFSRREQLAGAITASPSFDRNTANRLWAMMMGRGLVHPLDLDHSDNPPSHPELLDLLAREFAEHRFDVKYLLREIALSQAYQRSSELSADAKDLPEDRYLIAILKPLSAEQLAYATMQATGFTDSVRQSLKAPTDAAMQASLSAQVPAFVKMFAAAPGQPEDDFETKLDQTLFLKYNQAIRGLISVRPGSLLDRTIKLTDPAARANELFLGIFNRPATADEKKEIADMMKNAKNPPEEALGEIIWAMLASAEFRFNH